MGAAAYTACLIGPGSQDLFCTQHLHIYMVHYVFVLRERALDQMTLQNLLIVRGCPGQSTTPCDFVPQYALCSYDKSVRLYCTSSTTGQVDFHMILCAM